MAGTPRRAELLDLTYAWALEHGLTDLSLRPLAAEIGSSASILLFYFESKERLQAEVLDRLRTDDLAPLADVAAGGLGERVLALWTRLTDPDHRGVLRLWTEAYARSVLQPDSLWAGFAAETQRAWQAALAAGQPAAVRRTSEGKAQRTAALAVLRGATLDLLSDGDVRRTTAAVRLAVQALA